MSDGHCKDCCCARAWKALGISEYTGKSIPEEITELAVRLAESQALNADFIEKLQAAWGSPLYWNESPVELVTRLIDERDGWQNEIVDVKMQRNDARTIANKLLHDLRNHTKVPEIDAQFAEWLNGEEDD